MKNCTETTGPVNTDYVGADTPGTFFDTDCMFCEMIFLTCKYHSSAIQITCMRHEP